MKTSVPEPTVKYSKVQLARLGVEVLDENTLLLRCVTCGRTWTPEPSPEGLLPHDWVCPNHSST